MLARSSHLPARAGSAPSSSWVASSNPLSASAPRGERGALEERSTGRKRLQRGISQHGLAQTGKAAALDQQPGIEVVTCTRLHLLEQLAAYSAGSGPQPPEPGRPHVHQTEARLQRIAAQDLGHS